MALRVAIDENDLKALEQDLAGRWSKGVLRQAGAYGGLSLAALGGGFLIYRAGAGWTATANSLSPLVFVGLGIGLMAAAAAGAYLLFSALRRAKKQALDDRIRQGLTIGSFDFFFSERCLTRKGPQMVLQAPWATLDGVEETRSAIIFRRKGEVLAFIPKNSIKDPAFFEKLQRAYGSAIENKLSKDGSTGARPHQIIFEEQASDLNEFRRAQRKHRTRSFGAWFLADSTNLRGRKGSLFGLSRQTAVTLSSASLFVSRNKSEEVYQWSAVERLLDGPSTAYLVLGPALAIPLPKRAFVNKVHFNTFCAFALAQIKASRDQKAAKAANRLSRSVAAGQPKLAARRPAALPAPKKQAQINAPAANDRAASSPGTAPDQKARSTRTPAPKVQAAHANAKKTSTNSVKTSAGPAASNAKAQTSQTGRQATPAIRKAAPVSRRTA